MKTKTTLLATALTMAFFGSAHAQEVIDITGSTAGRSTVNTTILANLSGVTYRFYRKSGSSTTAGSADGAIYKGSLNGTPVIVRTFWSGSAGGVRDVSNQVPLDKSFLAKSIDTTVGSGTQLPGNTAALDSQGLLAPSSAETTAEFGYSDVKQAATDHQVNTFVDEESMFVIPFVFDASESVTGITNITAQQARTHFTKGGETLKSLFTGVAADTTIIYAAGRDDDSGTRTTALAETGAGVFTPTTQWLGVVSGSEPGATVALGAYVGNGGYASGGDLSKVLSATGTQFIGLLGISDAITAEPNGAKRLSYEGIPFSISNVKNGSYTYWSYYQSNRMSLPPASKALALYNTLKTALKAAPTSSSGSSINLDEMTVERQADGATVTPK